MALGVDGVLCDTRAVAQVQSLGVDELLASTPLPTLTDVLALPLVRAQSPEVLVAGHGLDRPLRSVQVIERASEAAFINGGELLLSSGTGLPFVAGDLEDMARVLAKSDAAGLVVEIGGRLPTMPPSLVEACAKYDLPLVAVRPGLSFIRLAELVQDTIVDLRVSLLRMSDHAHEVFTQMCIDGASAPEIVSELARICGCPAVLENLVHQAIAYEPLNISPAQLLDDWESRSRDASAGRDLGKYGGEDWLSAWMEVRGRTWGRLVILPAGEATPRQGIALRRAATALALNRLLEQNQSTLERQAHRSTLVDIIEHRYRSAADMHAHTAALGVPTKNRILVGVVVDFLGVAETATGTRGSPADTVADAVSSVAMPALTSDLRRGRIGVLLSLAPAEDRKAALTRFVRELRKRGQGWADSKLIVAVGTNAAELGQVARSFAEAHQVADAARGANTEKLFYELPDIQLRGLLHVLGDDPRLQSFVERTLGTLLDFDSRNDSNLVDCLRTFLLHGGNKSAAAEAAHVARQTFYRRLATVQRILSMDLESAEVRTSLHAAIMALESQRLQRQDRAENPVPRSRSMAARRESAIAESAW